MNSKIVIIGGVAGGASAAGEEMIFKGVQGTAIVKSMGMTAAKTGLSESEAAGLSYFVSYTHSTDHADYYPGSEMLHIKLIVENGSCRILGAQIVGKSGIDKRIDVLATAIFAGMKVTDLEELDLAYAPQFSSAKDPVIMAGFVASNLHRKETRAMTYSALQEDLEKGEDIQLIDVRTEKEYKSGYLEHACNVPVDELRESPDKFHIDKKTVLYCKAGLRSYVAARIMQQHGFKNIYYLTGGILTCQNNADMEPNLDY